MPSAHSERRAMYYASLAAQPIRCCIVQQMSCCAAAPHWNCSVSNVFDWHVQSGRILQEMRRLPPIVYLSRWSCDARTHVLTDLSAGSQAVSGKVIRCLEVRVIFIINCGRVSGRTIWRCCCDGIIDWGSTNGIRISTNPYEPRGYTPSERNI
jgi:hypothetical protein